MCVIFFFFPNIGCPDRDQLPRDLLPEAIGVMLHPRPGGPRHAVLCCAVFCCGAVLVTCRLAEHLCDLVICHPVAVILTKRPVKTWAVLTGVVLCGAVLCCAAGLSCALWNCEYGVRVPTRLFNDPAGL